MSNWHQLPGLVQSIWHGSAGHPCPQIRGTCIWGMDHSVDKELGGWAHSRSCSQQFDTQMENGDKWCFLGALFSFFVGKMDCGIELTLSRCADDTKSCGVVSMREGRDAIHKDLNCLKRWAWMNLMNFNKAKCQVLHPGQGNSKHKQVRQRMDWECWLMTSSAWVSSEILHPRRPTISWIASKSGILNIKKGTDLIEQVHRKAIKIIRRLGHLSHQAEGGAAVVQPGKEKASRRPYYGFPIPKQGLQESWWGTVCQGACWQYSGFNLKECGFRIRAVRHWNRFHREDLYVPSLEVFKARLDSALGNLI